MRLIDADALLLNAIAISNSIGQVTWSAIRTIDVLAAPTVDALPVVHGKAIPIDSDIEYEDTLIRMDRTCDKCAALIHQMDNYCPNCGAKMDGERKDND